MLERFLSRRRATRVSQVLIGVVMMCLPCGSALAQFSSPAVSGVYNRAAEFGGGYSGGGYGGASYGDGMNSGYGANDPYAGFNGGMNPGSGDFRSLMSSLSNEPIEITKPEYVYKGHDAKEPVLSAKFFMYNNGREYKYAVLSGSGDTTARLWDLDGKFDPQTTEWFVTGARLRKQYKDEHKQGVTDASFSPDFKYVLTSSYDQIGRLWKLSSEDNIRVYRSAKDRLWAIEAAPSGEFVVAACNDGRIYFWESIGSANLLGTLPNRKDAQSTSADSQVGHEGPVFDVAVDPTSRFVASAGADGTVRLWNVELARQVNLLKGHADKVYSVTFSEDGQYLLTASRDKTARLWDPQTGEEVCRFVGHTGAVRQAFFADRYVCTASDDGTIRLWLPQNANSQRNNDGSMNTMNASMGTSGSPMGMGGGYASDMYGASQSGASGRDGAQNAGVTKPVRKPGRTKGVEYAIFEAGTPVFSADVSQDGVYLCGACADGTVQIWRMPGRARYYGDYGVSPDQNGGSSGGVLGSDPMADSATTLSNPGALTPLATPGAQK